MRRKAKVDANQETTVAALRQIPNISVCVTSSIGEGFPDLVIGYRGKNFLIEIKDGNKVASARKLTQRQERFHESWKGEIYICKSVDEILNIILK